MIEKSKFRVLIAYPNLSMMLTPSYAVGLFTALLKAQGYQIDLFDCTPYLASYEFMKEPLPVTRANSLLNSRKFDAKALFGDARQDLLGDFAKKMDSFKPHAVIFSTVVEDTWPQARDMLKILTEQYADVKTLLGGVFTTMAPDIVIQSEYIQSIGLGEGEETVVEFCESVRTGSSLANIHGTWHRDGQGNVTKNPKRPLVNINHVMADFSLFDERRFFRPLGAKIWKTIPLETYRGCPYTCTFCNSPAQVTIAKESGQGYFLRRKSIEILRKEIVSLMDRYKPEFFYINDDAFMARPKQEIAEFSEMYKDFKIPFWFQTRFEDIDEEKLTWLKSVGCYRISFGLEHGNEKYRKDILRRNISNEMILKQAKVVTQVGIPFTLNNIVGFPYETRDLMFESMMFNRAIGTFDALSVNVFVPYHGTVLRDMAIKEGWLDPERQTTSVIAESILNMPAPYLSGKEILGLQRVFPLYVRMPQERYSEIRKAENFDEEGNKTFEKLSKDFYEMVYGVDEADRMLTYVG